MAQGRELATTTQGLNRRSVCQFGRIVGAGLVQMAVCQGCRSERAPLAPTSSPATKAVDQTNESSSENIPPSSLP